MMKLANGKAILMLVIFLLSVVLLSLFLAFTAGSKNDTVTEEEYLARIRTVRPELTDAQALVLGGNVCDSIAQDHQAWVGDGGWSWEDAWDRGHDEDSETSRRQWRTVYQEAVNYVCPQYK